MKENFPSLAIEIDFQEVQEAQRIRDEEIANQSAGKFKALVIKMLTELIELGQKMKDTQNEKEQNIQGTNSDRRKPGFKATIWNKRKK